ncbi:MAG: hypothetical protein FWD41_04815 [Actinomycetia bacterium]|nr:hypothetical protein [Actinomycetes bacterium]
MSPKQEIAQQWIDAVTPDIRAAVEERAKDGAITCTIARIVAEELEVPYQVIGAAANQSDVRIINCSLGCF